MARPLRLQYPDAWYHVMNRGRRKEKIYLDNKDYYLFIEVLKETVDMWGLNLAAYCLMPNHYHLLINTPAGNISRCMRHINGVYTQRFNLRHKIDGQLFRGRYKAVLVENDPHLLELLRYIHRNPVRAGLVEEPENYPWSSYKGYTSMAEKWTWLYKDFLLAMLSENRGKAVKLFKAHIMREESKETLKLFSGKKWPSIFGSEGFRDWVKNEFQHIGIQKEIPETALLTPSAESIITLVGDFYRVSREQLLETRRGHTHEARDVAIYLLRRHGMETLVETGRHFNMPNYSSVSSAVSRTKKRMAEDKALRERIAEIEKRLNKSQKET